MRYNNKILHLTENFLGKLAFNLQWMNVLIPEQYYYVMVGATTK